MPVTEPCRTVYVVDDDASVRKSFGRLLRTAGYQVETFASADEFLAHPLSIEPGCLLLDLKMPGRNGLELQEALVAARKAIPIIFVTGHGDVSTSVRAMKGGAVDFLTKPYSAEDLLEAVERAMAKDKRDRRERAQLTDLQSRARALTPREAEVLRLVVRGLLNKQVAAELGISEKTVKVHRARVMQKMRADSMADLVRMAGRLHPPGAH
ncbi:MAG TPA: response regulator [Pseudomonadales bacterium]|nr:response regulator [Pseudomonadales bacterium]